MIFMVFLQECTLGEDLFLGQRELPIDLKWDFKARSSHRPTDTLQRASHIPLSQLSMPMKEGGTNWRVLRRPTSRNMRIDLWLSARKECTLSISSCAQKRVWPLKHLLYTPSQNLWWGFHCLCEQFSDLLPRDKTYCNAHINKPWLLKGVIQTPWTMWNTSSAI